MKQIFLFFAFLPMLLCCKNSADNQTEDTTDTAIWNGPEQFIFINSIDVDFQIPKIRNWFGPQTGKKIAVGESFIIYCFERPHQTLMQNLNRHLSEAENYGIPVLVQLDAISFMNARPDLWNWWDESKAGYNPDNRNNVEWTSWSPDDAVKIGWLNWGSQIRLNPMPNLMSAKYRESVTEAMNAFITRVLEWASQLPDDKKWLFAGIKATGEMYIGVNNWYYPNGNSYLDKDPSQDPKTGVNVYDLPSRGVQTIGYAALKTANIKSTGAITGDDIAMIAQKHSEYCASICASFGIPRQKIFSHAAGVGKELEACVTSYSCPSWSFYGKEAEDPTSFTDVNAILSKSDAPYFGISEWSIGGSTDKTKWNSIIQKGLAMPRCRFLSVYDNVVGNIYNGTVNPAAVDGIKEAQKYRDNTAFVNPFIGADGGGYTFPGAAMPSGIVKLGPDCNNLTENAGWDANGLIKGFSHTHINGSGGGCKYGNILFTPTTGIVKPDDYGSERRNETSEIGLYSVEMPRYDVKVRLSASRHAGIHEYTFPKTDQANILIDLGSFLSSYERQEFVGSEIRILSDTEVEGYSRIRGGWNIGSAYTVYFYAQFDTPATSYGTWKAGKLAANVTSQYDSNEKTGAFFTFNTGNKSDIKVKVGISYLGINKARHNINEINTWNVDDVKNNAVTEWNTILNLINLEGGTDEQRTIFYSSLYRIFLQPVDYTNENPVWNTDKPYFGDYHAIWDTYRATHPFINLLKPTLGGQMMESLVDIYRHDDYMPDARTSHYTGRTQGGSNCDMLIADAFVKNVPGVDYHTALKAMLKNATVPPGDDERRRGRGGLWDYNTIGYVSTDYERGVSRTFEYAPNDWAIATLARGLGQDSIYQQYRKQSSRWENLWNPNVESLGFKGFAWPRKNDGSWLSTDEFDVFASGSFEHPFYETFSWELSFYVPHDMKRLIEICGGAEAFSKRLDAYFSTPFPGKRDELLYYTKLYGMCQISNEPSFLTPSAYCYVNQQYKTANIVRTLMLRMYGATRDGVPGNDDSGSMGAWYAFHALGFFPVAGQDVYLISSPLFKKISITLENGKQFIITAQNADENNIYIQSCTLNGKPYNNNWFRHRDIADGAHLAFVMGDTPTSWDANGMPPPSK